MVFVSPCKLVQAALLAVIVVCPAGFAEAQRYPSRTVEVVVAYGPGGSTDLVARALAQKFQDRLGQSVVVLNKPGASGSIGATLAARAAPDGHTLYVGYTAETVVVPQISKSAKFSIDDFEPIAVTGLVPLVLITSKNVRANKPAGADRGALRPAREVQLWRRHRQPAAHHGGVVQPAQQARRGARSLSRRRAGGRRRDRRPYRHVLCRPRRRQGRDQFRLGQGAGGERRRALVGAAQGADLQGGGREGFRAGELERADGAQGHARRTCWRCCGRRPRWRSPIPKSASSMPRKAWRCPRCRT